MRIIHIRNHLGPIHPYALLRRSQSVFALATSIGVTIWRQARWYALVNLAVLRLSHGDESDEEAEAGHGGA